MSEETLENEDLGVGACPCGSTPGGLWVPAQIGNTSRPALWSEALGRQAELPKLNALTRDLVVDERGRTQGWTTLRHHVLVALLTDKGSSAVADLGVARPKGKLTPSSLREWERSARAALQHLLKSRRMELVSLTAARRPTNPSAAVLTVKFRDLLSGEDDEVTID